MNKRVTFLSFFYFLILLCPVYSNDFEFLKVSYCHAFKGSITHEIIESKGGFMLLTETQTENGTTNHRREIPSEMVQRVINFTKSQKALAYYSKKEWVYALDGDSLHLDFQKKGEEKTSFFCQSPYSDKHEAIDNELIEITDKIFKFANSSGDAFSQLEFNHIKEIAYKDQEIQEVVKDLVLKVQGQTKEEGKLGTKPILIDYQDVEADKLKHKVTYRAEKISFDNALSFILYDAKLYHEFVTPHKIIITNAKKTPNKIAPDMVPYDNYEISFISGGTDSRKQHIQFLYEALLMQLMRESKIEFDNPTKSKVIFDIEDEKANKILSQSFPFESVGNTFQKNMNILLGPNLKYNFQSIDKIVISEN